MSDCCRCRLNCKKQNNELECALSACTRFQTRRFYVDTVSVASASTIWRSIRVPFATDTYITPSTCTIDDTNKFTVQTVHSTPLDLWQSLLEMPCEITRHQTAARSPSQSFCCCHNIHNDHGSLGLPFLPFPLRFLLCATDLMRGTWWVSRRYAGDGTCCVRARARSKVTLDHPSTQNVSTWELQNSTRKKQPSRIVPTHINISCIEPPSLFSWKTLCRWCR